MRHLSVKGLASPLHHPHPQCIVNIARSFAPTHGHYTQAARKSSLPTWRHTRSHSTTPDSSAKLAALHARLSLPPRFSHKTLARCLIHPSADPRPDLNNTSLALLGQQLLAYYTAEWLMCYYPRLPIEILFAAEYAYTGPRTLAQLCREWGVDPAAAPGPEVDPGLLQFERVVPGNSMASDTTRVKHLSTTERKTGTGRANEQWNYRRGMSSRIVYDDEFGDLRSDVESSVKGRVAEAVTTTGNADTTPDTLTPETEAVTSPARPGAAATLETASATFIRAVFGALYLHSGSLTVQSFHEAHILSRHLAMHKLFDFKHPTRDLSRLCAREEFPPPVARLISETGRHSRTPVFVVGVYSGLDKLGEDSGASLNEARFRAAAAALRSWYLYSPPRAHVQLPSRQKEIEARNEVWRPQMVDVGEIVS